MNLLDFAPFQVKKQKQDKNPNYDTHGQCVLMKEYQV